MLVTFRLRATPHPAGAPPELVSRSLRRRVLLRAPSSRLPSSRLQRSRSCVRAHPLLGAAVLWLPRRVMSKRTRLRSGFTTSRAQQGLPHGRQRTASYPCVLWASTRWALEALFCALRRWTGRRFSTLRCIWARAERAAAAVGGQQKPHTIAQAIVQLEHCRDVAQMRSEAAAGAQGSNTEAPATLLAAGAAPLPASAVVTAASPAPTPISTAAVAASVLQARIAAAIREEQVAAAKAATKRKELTALRSELSMFATQAAGSNAQPLGRRVHAPRAGAVRPPDLAEHI